MQEILPKWDSHLFTSEQMAIDVPGLSPFGTQYLLSGQMHCPLDGLKPLTEFLLGLQRGHLGLARIIAAIS